MLIINCKMTILLDGKTLAAQIQKNLEKDVSDFYQRTGIQPGLATILVGNDASSAVYVDMKTRACHAVGIHAEKKQLSQNTTTRELKEEVERLNLDPKIHGILLQHPVPHPINERECFNAIALGKDVDGVTSHGFGRMAMGEQAFESATPKGIMQLLAHYKIDLAGKNAVVVGRSPILGKPMAMLLLNANATVTICHSQTRDLAKIISGADIVVGAVGKPEFIKASWIKKNAVVVDAGYHPQKVGDIEISVVKEKCHAYTPVPGGVGPMTICMLLVNTLEAARRQFESRKS